MVLTVFSVLLAGQLTLHQALDASVSKRAELTSFEVKFVCSNTVSQQSNDGAYAIDASTKSEGLLVFDQLTGLVLVRQFDELLECKATPPSFEKEYREKFVGGEQFRLITDSSDYVWSSQRGRFVVKKRDVPPTYLDLPFYLHGYGLATLYDASVKTPLEQMAEQQKKLLPDIKGALEDGKLKYRLGGIVYHFDETSLWPVHQSSLRQSLQEQNGKMERVALLNYSTDMELVEFQDNWVPKQILLKSADRRSAFSFEWLSINETIDPDRFDIPTIEQELLESVSEPRGKKISREDAKRP